MSPKCFTPLIKQCFVTSGVAINFATHGLVMGFSSILVPQLRENTDINESVATWIASIIGISLLLGALLVPLIMNRYGRRPANICSAALMTTGWIFIVASESAYYLFIARFLQGFSMGLVAYMGNIFIGECCSPRNRGALLMTISLSIMLGISLIHWLGTVTSSLQNIAFICACVAFFDLVIIILSPESPSFYATQGKYEECRKVYHWLRGYSEEEELDKLIKVNMARASSETTLVNENISDLIRSKVAYIKRTLSKREVYMPVTIMLHLYGINQWAGAITFDTNAKDILDVVLGKNANYPIIIVSLDLQRLVSNVLGMIVVKLCRRKLVLAVTISINVIAYFSIALYVFLKTHGLLWFDHISIGLALVHIHLFAVTVGAIPLPNVIAGEVFPLEHRGLCGMIGIIFFSINETINIKSARYLLTSIGVHGAYTVYGLLIAYFLIVAWILLPETKDRVLLDIEEEFRGKPLFEDDNLMKETVEMEKDEIDLDMRKSLSSFDKEHA